MPSFATVVALYVGGVLQSLRGLRTPFGAIRLIRVSLLALPPTLVGSVPNLATNGAPLAVATSGECHLTWPMVACDCSSWIQPIILCLQGLSEIF